MTLGRGPAATAGATPGSLAHVSRRPSSGRTPQPEPQIRLAPDEVAATRRLIAGLQALSAPVSADPEPAADLRLPEPRLDPLGAPTVLSALPSATHDAGGWGRAEQSDRMEPREWRRES